MEYESNQKKVVFLLTSLAGGGGERVMLDVATALSRRGQLVELLVMSRAGALEGSLPEGLKIRELEASRFFSAAFRLASYLKRERPHAVIATSEHMSVALLLGRILSKVNVRVVLRIGVPLSLQWKRYRGLKDRLLPVLSRWLYPKADALIAVSKGVAADAARALRIPLGRFSVIYHPKDVDSLDAVAREEPDHPWLREKEVPVIVAAGRLREQKGFDVLLRAFASVRKGQQAHLIIFGEGGERQALERLVRELGVDGDVSLAGFSRKLYANMAQADVFVLPSRWEGLPGALLEAMTLGVPVIAADCPHGPRELLSPESDPEARLEQGMEEAPHGMLVAVADQEALSQALTTLLSSAEPRRRYAKAAKERGREIALEDPLVAYGRALGL